MMATSSKGKPTPKKAPARKRTGPTRAQALKALGLTAADLDTLKAFREFQEQQTAPQPVAPVVKEDPQEYIRNITGSEVGVRFDRHGRAGSGNKRINLRPRGQRGDMVPIEPADKKDPVFNANLGRIFELLDEEQAQRAYEGQTTNQQAVHPALATLRNEHDEPYSQGAIKVEPVFEEQGIVVAEVSTPDPSGETNKQAGKVERRDVGDVRVYENLEPEHAKVPGSEDLSLPLDPERARDAIARQRGRQGPSAGLHGITNVSVEPVQRT
jgi:hypothetical protein